MPVTFPGSPTIGDLHSSGGRRWRWNGTGWQNAQMQLSRPGPAPSGDFTMQTRVGFSIVQTDSNAELTSGSANLIDTISIANVHTHGFHLDANTWHPAAGVFNWSSFDARMDTIPAGVDAWITLCGCPNWMRDGDTSGYPITWPSTPVSFDFKPPLAEHIDAWVDMAVAIVERYDGVTRPQTVKVVQPWNEMKGMFSSSLGRWYYEYYVTMWDAVKPAIEAVRPDILLAGSYPVLGMWKTGNSVNWQSGSPAEFYFDTRDVACVDALLPSMRSQDIAAVDTRNRMFETGVPYTPSVDEWEVQRIATDWVKDRFSPRTLVISEWYAFAESSAGWNGDFTAWSPTTPDAEAFAIWAWSLIGTIESRADYVLLWAATTPGYPVGVINSDGSRIEPAASVLEWIKGHLGSTVHVDRGADTLELVAVDGSILVNKATFAVTVT